MDRPPLTNDQTQMVTAATTTIKSIIKKKQTNKKSRLNDDVNE